MTDFYSQNRCVCSTRSHGPLLCAFCLSFHFNILQGGYTLILSLSTSEGMGLLKIQDCDSLGSVYSVCATTTGLSANDVLTEYEDVFKGLGRLKDTYTSQIDESVRPVVHAPRRVPVPVREQLREKLDELVNDAVIAPVTSLRPPTGYLAWLLCKKQMGKSDFV